MSPSINYLPDPKDPSVMWPQNDPHYSAAQQYYNDLMQYRFIDQQHRIAGQNDWNQWAIGAVRANEAGQFATYRPAPVAQKSYVVTWDGTSAQVNQTGPLVFVPEPNWNPADWGLQEVIPTNGPAYEKLVKINDPARNRQTGGFAGVGTSAGTTSPDIAALQALVAALLQKLGEKV